MQPDEFILNPMASINLPDFYTCAQCQASQPAGFNYCGGCGAPIVSKNEIPPSIQEEIRSIGAIIWPRPLVYKSTIGVPQARGCVPPHPSCGSKRRTDMSRTAKSFASRRLSEVEDMLDVLIATLEILSCSGPILLPEQIEIQMTCMPCRVGTIIMLFTLA